MKVFKTIVNLFSPGNKAAGLSQVAGESKGYSGVKPGDTGTFIYEDDGFIFQFQQEPQKVKWADIEQLIAYKVDLLTIDEICLDIIYNNRQLTITEETPGWEQFTRKLALVFPQIPQNWQSSIIYPAFATNLLILYQRAG